MTAPTTRIPAMEAAATEAANDLEYAEVRLHRALQAIERCKAKAEQQRQKADAAAQPQAKKRAQEAAKAAEESLKEARADERDARAELKEAEDWVRQLEKLNGRFVTDYEKRLAETRREFMRSRSPAAKKKKPGAGKRAAPKAAR